MINDQRLMIIEGVTEYYNETLCSCRHPLGTWAKTGLLRRREISNMLWYSKTKGPTLTTINFMPTYQLLPDVSNRITFSWLYLSYDNFCLVMFSIIL